MPDTVTRIDPSDVAPAAAAEDRFDRFRLISWWDQRRLAAARVLVLGAGALGNEIVKNLALLGVGRVLIADMDRVENSNLSRSVLFRAADAGRPKAEVAAEAARHLYPDGLAHAFAGDVVNELGRGAVRWADVVLAGLDNREARLWVNAACFALGRPWVDGAIEQISGVARVFVPDGHAAAVPGGASPCYECTMSERDWQLVRARRSCNLLTRDEMLAGRTPTTPTVGSMIAGLQVQEAVKLLHGLPTMAGSGLVFSGQTADAYRASYQRKADCPAHALVDDVLAIDGGVADVTGRDVLALAERACGRGAVIEFGRDLVERLTCPRCGDEQAGQTPAGKLRAADVACPGCGAARAVRTYDKLRGGEPFLGRTLAAMGVPPFDVLVARGPGGSPAVGMELAGDAARVLGPLADAGLEWA